MRLYVIREKIFSPIWLIIISVITTLLLLLVILSNSGLFSKNHTYVKGKTVEIHNVNFTYEDSIRYKDKNGSHLLEELVRNNFKNRIEYKGNTYEYFRTYYNDYTDVLYLDRYIKIKEKGNGIHWGNSYKNKDNFLDVDVDYNGNITGLKY